jgi:hypothetical protein
MELHHAPVTFGLIVSGGNAWIVEEAQRVPLARCETQEQDVSVAARRAAARFWLERLDLLGQAFRARETVKTEDSNSVNLGGIPSSCSG